MTAARTESRLFRIALLGSVAGTLLLPVVQILPARAQDAAQQGETVVVTGSRIRRNEFNSASPVQVLDPEMSELKGAFDTAELIQQSSIAAGSAQITSALSSNFVTNGGQGAETISLRGLGAERTLVLLNGRRAGPAGTRGAVNSFDLNVLPQSIIDRVEIEKDGASSVYGSDAVAGVVNILTRKNTDGIELTGTTSQPFDSGGAEDRFSATWGKAFGDNHILISGDYYHQHELARGDRKYLNCGEERIYDPTTGQRSDLIDPRTGHPHCSDLPWGQIWMYDYHDYAYFYGYSAFPTSNLPGPSPLLLQPDYGDNLASYIPALAAPRDPYDLVVPAGYFPVGYDPASQAVMNESHPFVEDVTVIPDTERYTLYVDGSYQITDGIEAYTELLFNRRYTYQNSYRQFWTFGFSSDFGPGLNAFFPPNVASLATGPYLESPTAVTDWSDTWQKVDYYRAVGGFRGEFESGLLPNWAWDIYGQYSRNKGAYSNQQIFQDSIDYQYAIGFGAGPCEGLVTPVSQKDCVTINWWDPAFLAGDIPQNARDYLFGVETGHTKYIQSFVEGSMTGDVFDLPAGTVGVAVGGVIRRDSIDDLPGEITLASNAWGNTAAGRTHGASNTYEVYGETIIPIVKDLPFVKSFEFEASVRWTEVSTFGQAYTHSYKLNWEVNDWLRLRGTTGTSFRAPALFELFLADQTSFLSQRNIDPCINWGTALANGDISQQLADNCAAEGVPSNHSGAGITATIITGGGLGVLDAETSTARTVSAVLTPDFLLPDTTKLSIAVDYFEIEVKGEITQLGANNIVAGCLTSDFYPTDPLCDLYRRNIQVPGSSGDPYNIFDVRDSFININDQVNRGLDVTVQVDQELPGEWGDLSVFSQMTWQFKDTVALFQGTTQDNNGQDGEPYWVGNVNVLWTKGPWKAFWGVDLIGRTSDESEFLKAQGPNCEVTDTVHNGPYCVDVVAEWRNYHNASLTRSFDDDRYRLTVGVSNLFDAEPPKVSEAGTNRQTITTVGQVPYESQYDYVGRRLFLNLKASF